MQLEFFKERETRPLRKRGRKKFELDQRLHGIAEAMLTAGATATEISTFLNVSRPTVRGIFGNHPFWNAKSGPRPVLTKENTK